MHLIPHIVSGIKQFGPVYGTWMYPYERFNSWMCRRALNRAHPEVTIMETYRVSFMDAHTIVLFIDVSNPCYNDSCWYIYTFYQFISSCYFVTYRYLNGAIICPSLDAFQT